MKDIPYNLFEESISMIERTALKLLPIMKELGVRLAGQKLKRSFKSFRDLDDEEESDKSETPREDD